MQKVNVLRESLGTLVSFRRIVARQRTLSTLCAILFALAFLACLLVGARTFPMHNMLCTLAQLVAYLLLLPSVYLLGVSLVAKPAEMRHVDAFRERIELLLRAEEQTAQDRTALL